jgi:hypothetical protein
LCQVGTPDERELVGGSFVGAPGRRGSADEDADHCGRRVDHGRDGALGSGMAVDAEDLDDGGVEDLASPSPAVA